MIARMISNPLAAGCPLAGKPNKFRPVRIVCLSAAPMSPPRSDIAYLSAQEKR